MVPVTVISQKGQSALVEFERNGIPYRSYVDALDLQDGACPEERLADAPHGIVWDFDLGGLGQELERALKLAGIWTYEDLAERHRKLIRISTDLLGKRVWDAAKRWRKRSN